LLRNECRPGHAQPSVSGPRLLIGMQLAPRYQRLKRTVPGRRRQASWSPVSKGKTMQTTSHAMHWSGARRPS